MSEPTDDKGKFDEMVEERGVRILIEPAALMHVIGTTMDYVEDRIKCAAPVSFLITFLGFYSSGNPDACAFTTATGRHQVRRAASSFQLRSLSLALYMHPGLYIQLQQHLGTNRLESSCAGPVFARILPELGVHLRQPSPAIATTVLMLIVLRRRSEFVFNNPNSKGACGCGESWTPK